MGDWIYISNGREVGKMSPEYNKYDDIWLNDPQIYQYKYHELYLFEHFDFYDFKEVNIKMGVWVYLRIRNVGGYTCFPKMYWK